VAFILIALYVLHETNARSGCDQPANVLVKRCGQKIEMIFIFM
jgi:hypothetical protein